MKTNRLEYIPKSGTITKMQDAEYIKKAPAELPI